MGHHVTENYTAPKVTTSPNLYKSNVHLDLGETVWLSN